MLDLCFGGGSLPFNSFYQVLLPVPVVMIVLVSLVIGDPLLSTIVSTRLEEGRQTPNKYVQYLERFGSDPSVNRAIFEFLICETLVRKGITLFYFQVKFKLAPNVEIDIALYNPLRPVVLSAKVSLREHWKQANQKGSVLNMFIVDQSHTC
ncbi:MAG: hypothetical protein M2R45_02219 [Verrucomicrobia subdivision 3 bacterium]|nr:hypothetical protein [Limisphaerales bacterium]MCS1413996.1 hypothetical protein [Limisphaerales bacterium]